MKPMRDHADSPLRRRIAQLREPVHKTTRTGKVVGIREHYDDKGLARVELEDEVQPKPKKGPDGKAQPSSLDYMRTFDATVPKTHAQGIAIGDRVHVRTTVEKAGD